MSTLNKYRFELLELINQTSDDSEFDYRYLDQLIINKRAKWFENTYNKFSKVIPNIYYQTLACINVIPVDQSECCSIETKCYVLRTEHKLPTPISLSDGELIEKVYPVGIVNKGYNIIPFRRVEYFGTGRFNKDAVGAFFYNNYIYLISKEPIYYPQIQQISVRMVLIDPREAAKFKDCDNVPCFNPDSPFPLEPRLWEYCKEDIKQTDLATKLKVPVDNNNDSSDNLLDPTKPGNK